MHSISPRKDYGTFRPKWWHLAHASTDGLCAWWHSSQATSPKCVSCGLGRLLPVLIASFSASPWQPRQTAECTALPGGVSLWQTEQSSPLSLCLSARYFFGCAQVLSDRLTAPKAKANRRTISTRLYLFRITRLNITKPFYLSKVGRGGFSLSLPSQINYFHGLSAAAFLPAMRPKTMHSVRLPPPW